VGPSLMCSGRHRSAQPLPSSWTGANACVWFLMLQRSAQKSVFEMHMACDVCFAKCDLGSCMHVAYGMAVMKFLLHKLLCLRNIIVNALNIAQPWSCTRCWHTHYCHSREHEHVAKHRPRLYSATPRSGEVFSSFLLSAVSLYECLTAE